MLLKKKTALSLLIALATTQSALASNQSRPPIIARLSNNLFSMIKMEEPKPLRAPIFDPYSGIRINFAQNEVFFSYLDEKHRLPNLLKKATPETFELLHTGTDIVARDQNFVFLISGTEQKIIPSINPESLEIIIDENAELVALRDGENNHFNLKPELTAESHSDNSTSKSVPLAHRWRK